MILNIIIYSVVIGLCIIFLSACLGLAVRAFKDIQK